MTKQEPEFLECDQGSDLNSLPDSRRRGKTEAVSEALDYLFRLHQNRHWSTAPGPGPGSDSLNTACVLARLKDALPGLPSHRLLIKVNESLDWLVETQTPAGGWQGCSGDNEAGPTAWAILALAKNGRTVSETALNWIRRCPRQDGGFATCTGDTDARTLETTALASQALGHFDSDAERFLCARLECDAASPAEQLAASAAILDCDKSLVPLPLLNQACQVTARVQAESAADQALLLRCLLRLRLTRAWLLANSLRAMQLADGSWPGPNENKIITTATAASALVLIESQPGLYFGSDLPRPRRLRESS